MTTEIGYSIQNALYQEEAVASRIVKKNRFQGLGVKVEGTCEGGS